MTANLQQGSLLDVLKKKMRQTKEEMEKYKDECEEYHKKLQLENMRREEVRFFLKKIIFRLLNSAIPLHKLILFLINNFSKQSLIIFIFFFQIKF